MRNASWQDALAEVPALEKYECAEDEVCVALGSNQGNRLTYIQRGIDSLATIQAERDSLRLSSLYESTPVDCPPGSSPFLNAVALFRCDLQPHQLLDVLKKFEERAGRNFRSERNAPRPLDLDIVYFGKMHFSGGSLSIPHPRAILRRFVLLPLAELRPHLVLPGEEMTVVQLLGMLNNSERLRRVAGQPK